MKNSVVVNTLSQLQSIDTNFWDEVVVGIASLSRIGRAKLNDLIEISDYAQKLNKKCVLEFDILVNQVDFKNISDEFLKINENLYQSIRVQDPGVLFWLLTYSKKPLQMNLENGHHNFQSVKYYEDLCGDRLEKIILSVELKSIQITEYISQLKTQIELLLFGPILLFYTPRKLLAPVLKDHDSQVSQKLISDEFLYATGESEESPHKGFPIIENRHGTFMFHIKDLSLLKFYEELKAIGLSWGRFDLRKLDENVLVHLNKILNLESESRDEFLKQHFQIELTRGFYKVNKTDVLFPKLKNTKIQRQDDSFIGEVIDIEKDKFILVRLENEISLHDELKCINPEGREMEQVVSWINHWDGKELCMGEKGEIVKLPYLKKMIAKSKIYKKNAQGRDLAQF
jgi:putative protease